MESFDYQKSVERLEKIMEKVEDPSTGLDDIDNYVKQAQELIQGCRNYLRSVRDNLQDLGL